MSVSIKYNMFLRCCQGDGLKKLYITMAKDMADPKTLHNYTRARSL